MKRILLVACLSMLFCAGCQKDDADISSDPADLVGKWKLVKESESWKEDGRWQTEIDFEESAGDTGFYYHIYAEDGTYEYGVESKSTGEIEVFGRGTWSYSGKKIYCTSNRTGNPDDYYEYSMAVTKLTSSQLIVRGYSEDYSDYTESSYVRME